MTNARDSRYTFANDGDDVKLELQLVSAKTLANELDTSSTSVRRWLQAAGIDSVMISRGRKGAVKYSRSDVQRWLEALERFT